MSNRCGTCDPGEPGCQPRLELVRRDGQLQPPPARLRVIRHHSKLRRAQPSVKLGDVFASHAETHEECAALLPLTGDIMGLHATRYNCINEERMHATGSTEGTSSCT